jgi:hypothetical protein
MEIRAANRTCGESDDRIGWFLDRRIFDVIEADVPNCMKNNGAHDRLLLIGLVRGDMMPVDNSTFA